MAKCVADLCSDKQISMAELVEKSGLPEPRVQAIVMGRWTPSPQERTKIAGALGVEVPEIAWGHKTPIQHLYGHGPG
jgi:transcriptional regulator with XRE-family HTH domain